MGGAEDPQWLPKLFPQVRLHPLDPAAGCPHKEPLPSVQPLQSFQGPLRRKASPGPCSFRSGLPAPQGRRTASCWGFAHGGLVPHLSDGWEVHLTLCTWAFVNQKEQEHCGRSLILPIIFQKDSELSAVLFQLCLFNASLQPLRSPSHVTHSLSFLESRSQF